MIPLPPDRPPPPRDPPPVHPPAAHPLLPPVVALALRWALWWVPS